MINIISYFGFSKSVRSTILLFYHFNSSTLLVLFHITSVRLMVACLRHCFNQTEYCVVQTIQKSI